MDKNIILTQIPIEELKDIISNCIKEELSYSNKNALQIEDELIRMDEAVKLLHVSKVTLFKWREKGILPFYRISSRIYFKKNEVLEALNSSNKLKKQYATKTK